MLWCVTGNIALIDVFFYLPFEGVSKKAGAQAGPGFLSVETYPAPHKIPAAAEG